MHILITGKPRTGKTTLIKRIIDVCGTACGGFYTEEVIEKGSRAGFLIRTTEGEEGLLAKKGLPSPFRLGKYGIDVQSLDRIGVKAVEDALKNKKIVVIDEIGKMELFSERFKDIMLKVLDSDRKLVGVIHLAEWPYLNAIRGRSDVVLLEVNGRNNDEVFKKAVAFINSNG